MDENNDKKEITTNDLMTFLANFKNSMDEKIKWTNDNIEGKLDKMNIEVENLKGKMDENVKNLEDKIKDKDGSNGKVMKRMEERLKVLEDKMGKSAELKKGREDLMWKEKQKRISAIQPAGRVVSYSGDRSVGRK